MLSGRSSDRYQRVRSYSSSSVNADVKGNKAFHTSARAFSSPRKPVESDLAGEQNEHLKHKDAESSDSGKGNAASEPHLPSHNAKKSGSGSRDGAQSQTAEQTKSNPAQSGKASGAPKGFAAYHSSAVRLGQKERDGPGYAGTHTGEANRAGKVSTIFAVGIYADKKAVIPHDTIDYRLGLLPRFI